MITQISTGGGGGGGGGDSTAWTRPSDWLAMPTVGTTEQKVVGLHAVWPSDGNFCAVTCAGNYTVDWGDGTSTNHSSGAAAYKEYNYADISAATDSTRGYRQVIVTITPQAGANLTSVNFYTKHNQSGLQNGYSTGWLELLISAPNMGASGLSIGNSGTNVRQNLLERVAIIEQGSLNTYLDLFRQCAALRDVQLDDSAAVTSTVSMFANCRALTSVPLFNTAAVTNMSSMFSTCQSLTTVPLFNTAAVTNMSSMFSSCYALTTVPLFNTAAVTNMSSMFGSCNELVSVPLFNTAAVTNMSNMFTACYALGSVPLFNTAAVTNMSSMFASCFTLATVPTFNTAAVTNFQSMFETCQALSRVPALSASAAASFSSYSAMFNACPSLQSIDMTGHKFTFSVASCKLSATDLNTIYTNLATVTTAQTITVSGNYGTAGDDTTIATNKGWTVSG